MNNVGGSIPNEISTLYGATRIDLFGNVIGGTLPNGLSNLTMLELLDLEENMLEGQFFTEEVLGLTNLIGLRGSFNRFDGTIPTQVGVLTNLQQLWFAENMISSSIPTEIGSLTNLGALLGLRIALLRSNF